MTRAPQTQPGEPSRRRRIIRRLVIAALVTPVAVIVGGWLSQGLWLASVVRPVVEDLTGLESSSASLSLSILGELRVRGVTLRESGSTGPPVVKAREVRASLQMGNLIVGGPVIRGITLIKPTIRVDAALDESEPVEPSARVRRAFRGVLRLPEIEVVDGSVAFVEPGDANAAPVLTITGGGTIRRRGDQSSVYTVELEQTGAGTPIRLSGWIDLAARTAQLHAHDVKLTHWLDSCTIAREADLWRSIVDAGRLVDASVEYNPAGGLHTRMEVEAVRLSLPTPTSAEGAARLTLDEVSGVVTLDRDGVRAQVAGLIDGLPTVASMEMEGLGLTAPFHIDLAGGPFVFDSEWAALALVPGDVRTIIEDFSSPSARVAARIRLERTDPAGSADEGITVSGEIRVRDGAASFVEFPYPVHDIAGAVRFDEREIVLDGLTGVGPSGAPIRADGVVTPTPAGLELDLVIRSPAAPLDEALFAALDPTDADVVRDLFDEDAVRRLRAERLINTAGERDDALTAVAHLEADVEQALDEGDSERARRVRALLDEARAGAARPVFTLGGTVKARAHVVRSPLQRPVVRVTTDVLADSVGMAHRELPYPLVIDDLRLAIDNATGVQITAARVRGVTGATGAILGGLAWDDGAIKPALGVRFDSLSVDAVLLGAVAMAEERSGSTLGAARALTALGVGGAASLTGRIDARDSGENAWSVSAPIEGLVLRPDGESGPTLDALAGSFTAGHAGWSLTARGGAIDGHPANLSISAEGGPRDAEIRLASDALPLGPRVESFIAPLEPGLAAEVADLRAAWAPSGALGIETVLTTGRAESSQRVTLTPAGPIMVSAGAGRTVITPSAGRIELTPDGIVADGVAIALTDGAGASLGGFTVEGSSSARLTVGFNQAEIAAPVIRKAVKAVSDTARDTITELDPTGRFSGVVTLAREGRGWILESGDLRPHTLSLLREGERVDLGALSGRVTLGPLGGDIRSLTVATGAWTLTADGRWFSGPALGVDVQLGAGGRADSALIRLLPTEVAATLTALSADLGDNVELHDARLVLNAPTPGDVGSSDAGAGFRDGFRFSGTLDVASAALDVGAPLTDADGSLSIDIERPPSITTPRVAVEFRFTGVRVGGVRVTNLHGGVEADADRPGSLILTLDGEVHGGRLRADGSIDHVYTGTAAPDYTLSLRLAGLDLASVGAPGASASETGQSADGSKGFIDASLLVTGAVGAGGEALGGGEIRVLGGELARLPVVMSVLELGNIVPPVGEPLDYVSATYTVHGDLARFDRLIIASPSLALIGQGGVTLPDLALDLRFAVTGSRRLPVFSDLLDIFRNVLLTTRVRGTLTEPEVTGVPLSGPRRLFSRLLGRNPDRVVTAAEPD